MGPATRTVTYNDQDTALTRPALYGTTSGNSAIDAVKA
jgi:hypothetical protein